MVVRITNIILRIAGSLALLLGLLIWTGIAPGVVAIHMPLGILVVLCLWVMGGVMAATRGGLWLGIGAFILGLIVAFFGLNQRTILVGDLHWIIRTIHLLLGISAIAYGQLLTTRYQRLKTPAQAVETQVESR